MEPTEKLSQRRQSVLRLVIQEYVRTAQPVSSKSIVENYQLDVSPATIRNDLAALEQEGLLTHPYTSAGRVPTDAGYRYFVHHLMPEDDLPSAEQLTIRHQFYQARQEPDQWLRLSTSVLAQTCRTAALATIPQSTRSLYRHLELVSIRDAAVLLILVLQAGTVKQQLLTLDGSVTQEELSTISNELNEHLKDADADEIRRKLAILSPLAQQIALLVADIMARVDGNQGERIYRDGLAHILETPEFAEGDDVRRIIQVLEQRSLLKEILDSYLQMGDVHVLIDGEGRFAQLENISLVIGRYGVTDYATGVVGVIGPLRMPYGRTIGAVRFVAALMSELMQEIYGM